MASDMIKISNTTSENKPPWLLGELSEPTRTSLSGAPAGAVPGGSTVRHLDPSPPRLVAAARAVPLAGRVLLSWLAAIPRRLGDRLFAMNDAEAYWRSWQITRTHGGLGRRYRDPRFDTLAECPKCRGAGADRGPAVPALPGHGAGNTAARWASHGVRTAPPAERPEHHGQRGDGHEHGRAASA